VLEKPDVRALTVLGRLKPGVAVKETQAEIATLAAALAKQFPETNRDRSMIAMTLLRYRTSGVGGVLGTMVMTLGGAVLLVACFNVAGLLTSRAAGRAKEIAMRLAIGAGRARLIRQLLTESLLLALAGGVAGVGIGYLPVVILQRMMRQVLPENDYRPVLSFFKLDQRVVFFGVAIALASVVLFGLVPAFRTTRADLDSALRGSTAIPPRRRGLLFNRMWGRNLLVTAQVAISVLLLTVSSYIYVGIHNFIVAIRDQGFQAERVLSVNFDPIVKHYKAAQSQRFYEQLVQRLHAVAGVKSVTLASSSEATAVQPDGYQAPKDAGSDSLTVPVIWADPNFFEALEIPILQGRGLRGTDSAGAPPVAVVNESFVKHYWQGQDPIGKRIRVGDDRQHRWVEVVGVTAIKSYQGIISVPPPDLVFFPAAQNPKHPLMTLFARSESDPTALVASLRTVVREVDPIQAVPEVHSWTEMFEAIERGTQLATHIIGAMGAMGILLALVGLYGLVAFDVSTRTREIGIRMALGAASGKVLRMVLRQGAVLSLCGIGAGLLLNYGVGRLLTSLLPSTPNPRGPGVGVDFGYPTITMFVMVVLVLTMLAAYIPARRAARVDPNVALRCE
jgi:putative ABC transport system permease protein